MSAGVDGGGPPMRADNPILIIGTERSGSNLLRLILDVHSRIAIPHPPHFMRYLAPVAWAYGDLADEGCRRLAARDVCTLLRRHIFPWPHPIDEELVVARSSPHLFGVVAAVYELHRIAEGKPRWGCKSTFMVDHVDDVLAEYPGARFVWLIRDPRDVAASAKRSVFGYCHPHLTARLWLAQQERAAAALSQYGPGTVYQLWYEDLVARPDEQIAKLCAWLGETPEPAMLRPHLAPQASQLASMSQSWRNTTRPISMDNVGAHRRRLTPTEVAYVERAAGPMMIRLGYQPSLPVGATVIRPSPLGLWAKEAVLRIRVEHAALRRDRNATKRWLRGSTVRMLRARARMRARFPGWHGSRSAPSGG